MLCKQVMFVDPDMLLLKHTWDFPGGPLVKSPPAKAGDTG